MDDSEAMDMLHAALVHACTSLNSACTAVDAEPIWQQILTSYTEKHRVYHTLQHLISMMKHLVGAYGNVPISQLPPHTVLAVLFHDIIYDPTASDNEHRSAQLMEQLLKPLGINQTDLQRIQGYVLATEKHQIPQQCPLSQDTDLLVFLDVDLSILAADADSYRRYVVGIRQEYKHFNDQEFIAGRTAVLKDLMAKDHLYFSDYAKQQGWEENARSNVAGELAYFAIE